MRNTITLLTLVVVLLGCTDNVNDLERIELSAWNFREASYNSLNNSVAYMSIDAIWPNYMYTDISVRNLTTCNNRVFFRSAVDDFHFGHMSLIGWVNLDQLLISIGDTRLLGSHLSEGHNDYSKRERSTLYKLNITTGEIKNVELPFLDTLQHFNKTMTVDRNVVLVMMRGMDSDYETTQRFFRYDLKSSDVEEYVQMRDIIIPPHSWKQSAKIGPKTNSIFFTGKSLSNQYGLFNIIDDSLHVLLTTTDRITSIAVDEDEKYLYYVLNKGLVVSVRQHIFEEAENHLDYVLDKPYNENDNSSMDRKQIWRINLATGVNERLYSLKPSWSVYNIDIYRNQGLIIGLYNSEKDLGEMYKLFF